MRTKALLLAAAFAAAGVATSMAQVYSVNAVGYVNTILKPGFNLISNPLTAADNTIGKLFLNMEGGVPGGTTVYKFKSGGFVSTIYDDLSGEFGPPVASETTLPGGGVFVFLTGASDKKLTFVGEVSQGTPTVSIPPGFSVISSPVPQAGALDKFKNTDNSIATLPAKGGDTLYRYNTTTKGYNSFIFDDLSNAWDPALPALGVGEAVFYFHTGATTDSWVRTFSVNS